MRFFLTIALILGIVSQVDARRWHGVSPQASSVAPATVSSSPQDIGPVVKQLEEVNRQRAAKGLKPYIMCVELQRSAEECVKHRARHRIQGHTANDMSFAAQGYASCAGCAAWPNTGGFGACAILDNYTYAGAATVAGADGVAYHQLLLR